MSREDVIRLIAINVAAWFCIHMGFAWAGTRLPARWFNPAWFWFRARRLERGGKLYERLFRIKAWKDDLPDAAPWFKGGFAKAHLARSTPDYIQRFVVETCRGEAVHVAVMLAAGLFFLFNPPGVGVIMIVYGLCANLPCILVQRYNRIRLERMLGLRQPSHANPAR